MLEPVVVKPEWLGGIGDLLTQSVRTG